MAGHDDALSFGAELKDAFKPVNAWINNGIAWLDDISQFYRERSVLEKEYSAKLNVLAKRYFEKKAKKSSCLSVGDTPALTPGSLESASLTIWTTQLSTLEAQAVEHEKLANDLITRVADPLNAVRVKYDDIRKRHADYAAKLERERDAGYAELRKTKASYDTVCQEVENRRKKADTAYDFGKQKAQIAYQQHTENMHNVKNTYLININVTNKQKEKYYHEYIPEMLDSLQDLSETKTAKLNALWSVAAQLESTCLLKKRDHVKHFAEEISRNEPNLDSRMFIQHNAISWQEPADFVFEPSPVWHDDDAMATDDTAKVFLRNLMSKSKTSLGELRREVEKKRKEVEGVKRIRENVRAGKDKRDEVEIVTAILSLQEELHKTDHKRLIAEVETSTIQAAVGDVTLGAKNHNFKAQTFKIPTNCDLCGDRIWGLSAKGFDCRDCGYTCHSKCEMKVPATCPGEQSKEERKTLKAERQEAARVSQPKPNGSTPDGISELPALSRADTMSSLSSGYAASAHRSLSGGGPGRPSIDEAVSPVDRSATMRALPTKPGTLKKNRIVAPPPAQYIKDLSGEDLGVGGVSSSSYKKGKMLFAYQANGEGEVSITDGKEVTILEADDGTGWMKVRSGANEGVVPASYVEITTAGGPSADRPSSTYSSSSASLTSNSLHTAVGKKKGPAVAPKRGARKLKYVEALYDYKAQSSAEWSMSEGERFVLVNKDSGDGWADVEKGGSTRSVPANYIQEIS